MQFCRQLELFCKIPALSRFKSVPGVFQKGFKDVWVSFSNNEFVNEQKYMDCKAWWQCQNISWIHKKYQNIGLGFQKEKNYFQVC